MANALFVNYAFDAFEAACKSADQCDDKGRDDNYVICLKEALSKDAHAAGQRLLGLARSLPDHIIREAAPGVVVARLAEEGAPPRIRVAAVCCCAKHAYDFDPDGYDEAYVCCGMLPFGIVRSAPFAPSATELFGCGRGVVVAGEFEVGFDETSAYTIGLSPCEVLDRLCVIMRAYLEALEPTRDSTACPSGVSIRAMYVLPNRVVHAMWGLDDAKGARQVERVDVWDAEDVNSGRRATPHLSVRVHAAYALSLDASTICALRELSGLIGVELVV